MKAKLMMQLDNNNGIADSLISASEKKPKKIYFFMGSFKETGFDLLENCLIDSKAKKLFVIGIDKKNTTKKMLESLYKYTKNVYVYNNNDFIELDSNTVIFEYEKEAVVYSLSGNSSKGGLEDNIAIYTKLEFELGNKEDKSQYDEYIEELLKIIKMDVLRKLDKEYIQELLDNKSIFSNKQYTHNIMSISDLAKQAKGRQRAESEEKTAKVDSANKSVDIDNTVEDLKENIYDECAKLGLKNVINLEDMSFDIDIGDAVTTNSKVSEEYEEKTEDLKPKSKIKEEKKTPVKKTKKDLKLEEELMNSKMLEFKDEVVDFDPNSIIDLESMLFDKSAAKLDTRKIDKKEQKERKLKNEKADKEESKESLNKKIDLNKVSNIVMELSKKPSKGKDVTAIKIPNYIKDMVPNFFEAMESSIAVDKKDGLYKEAQISVEIVDTMKNKKYTDVSAILSNKIGQTYIAFMSDMLKNVEYEEGDIARLIKLSKEIYHIEIISKDSQEHKLWKKMCTQKFRGADKQYGVM